MNHSRSRSGEWLTALFLIVGVASLIGFCVAFSTKKPFWNDEINSWMLITDPSWRHMFFALSQGADGSFPLYFLLVRLWAFLFGPSELALRVFTSLGFCSAFIVLWWILKRHYKPLSIAVGMLAAFCASPLMLMQSVEARPYGILTLCFALAIRNCLMHVEERGSVRLLLQTTVVHVLLSWSHPFGVVYGAVCLLALAAVDFRLKQVRLRVYLAMLAGWLTLALWIGPMQRVASLGKPWGWRLAPNLRELVDTYRLEFGPVFLFLCFAIFLVVAERLRASRSKNKKTTAGAIVSLFIRTVSGFLLFVPVVVFAAAQANTSLFMPRYLLPCVIGCGLLLTDLTEGIFERAALLSLSIVPIVTWVIVLVCLSLPALAAITSVAAPVYPELIDAVGDRFPIAVEDMQIFMQLSFFNRRAERPFFLILDAELARKENSPRRASLATNSMLVWQQVGYWSDRIIQSREFLCRTPKFTVIATPWAQPWFETRVKYDAAFRSTTLKEIPGYTVVSVTRVGTPEACK